MPCVCRWETRLFARSSISNSSDNKKSLLLRAALGDLSEERAKMISRDLRFRAQIHGSPEMIFDYLTVSRRKVLARMFFARGVVFSACSPPFLRVRKKLRPWQLSSNGSHVR